MQKKDLVPGEVYALGDPGHWATLRKVPGKLITTDGERQGDEAHGERVLKGIVFELQPDGDTKVADLKLPYDVSRFHLGRGIVVLKSARHVIKPWAEFVETRAGILERAALVETTERAEEELLARAVAGLQSFGVEVVGLGRVGAVQRTKDRGVKFSPPAIEELVRRFEPLGVAGSAIELFVQALEATDVWDCMPPELRVEQIEAARDVALSQLRDGLAVTDAELEAPVHA